MLVNVVEQRILSMEDTAGFEIHEPPRSFDRRNLTLNERSIMGRTTVIDGVSIQVSEVLGDYIKGDEKASRALLTPVSVLDGKKTFEQAQAERQDPNEYFEGLLTPLDKDQQKRLMELGFTTRISLSEFNNDRRQYEPSNEITIVDEVTHKEIRGAQMRRFRLDLDPRFATWYHLEHIQGQRYRLVLTDPGQQFQNAA